MESDKSIIYTERSQVVSEYKDKFNFYFKSNKPIDAKELYEVSGFMEATIDSVPKLNFILDSIIALSNLPQANVKQKAAAAVADKSLQSVTSNILKIFKYCNHKIEDLPTIGDFILHTINTRRAAFTIIAKKFCTFTRKSGASPLEDLLATTAKILKGQSVGYCERSAVDILQMPLTTDLMNNRALDDHATLLSDCCKDTASLSEILIKPTEDQPFGVEEQLFLSLVLCDLKEQIEKCRNSLQFEDDLLKSQVYVDNLQKSKAKLQSIEQLCNDLMALYGSNPKHGFGEALIQIVEDTLPEESPERVMRYILINVLKSAKSRELFANALFERMTQTDKITPILQPEILLSLLTEGLTKEDYHADITVCYIIRKLGFTDHSTPLETVISTKIRKLPSQDPNLVNYPEFEAYFDYFLRTMFSNSSINKCPEGFDPLKVMESTTKLYVWTAVAKRCANYFLDLEPAKLMKVQSFKSLFAKIKPSGTFFRSVEVGGEKMKLEVSAKIDTEKTFARIDILDIIFFRMFSCGKMAEAAMYYNEFLTAAKGQFTSKRFSQEENLLAEQTFTHRLEFYLISIQGLSMKFAQNKDLMKLYRETQEIADLYDFTVTKNFDDGKIRKALQKKVNIQLEAAIQSLKEIQTFSVSLKLFNNNNSAMEEGLKNVLSTIGELHDIKKQMCVYDPLLEEEMKAEVKEERQKSAPKACLAEKKSTQTAVVNKSAIIKERLESRLKHLNARREKFDHDDCPAQSTKSKREIESFLKELNSGWSPIVSLTTATKLMQARIEERKSKTPTSSPHSLVGIMPCYKKKKQQEKKLLEIMTPDISN
jgi:hypothetical protein